MKWFKQLRCDHEYFKVGTEFYLDFRGDDQQSAHVYCPKCDKAQELNPVQADLLLEQQRIKKEFYKEV